MVFFLKFPGIRVPIVLKTKKNKFQNNQWKNMFIDLAYLIFFENFFLNFCHEKYINL